MDKKAFQIPLAEDKPADMAIIREALKDRHVECKFQISCDGGKIKPTDVHCKLRVQKDASREAGG